MVSGRVASISSSGICPVIRRDGVRTAVRRPFSNMMLAAVTSEMLSMWSWVWSRRRCNSSTFSAFSSGRSKAARSPAINAMASARVRGVAIS
eukprot:49846-Eustigmatos_ZCMA.PRE.1